MNVNDSEALAWVRTNMPNESAVALTKFIERNPHWQGAAWDDCLAQILDADGHLNLTERLCEAALDTQYPVTLVAAVGITMLYSSKPFAIEYTPEQQVNAVFAKIASLS